MHLEHILITLLGLCVGSFITMASYRLPRSEDIVFKRSHCPSCNHTLGIRDLIPVLSWLSKMGKCSHCHNKIHIRYPIIELITGVLFLFIYAKFGLNLYSSCLLLLATCFMIMSVVDFEHKIIPDSTQIFMIIVGLVYIHAANLDYKTHFISALVGLAMGLGLRYGFFLWKKKEGLGLGDVKFFTGAGLILGYEAFFPFLTLSGIIGVFIALTWKAMDKGEAFPFGPALCISAFFCIIYPEYLVDIFYIGK